MALMSAPENSSFDIINSSRFTSSASVIFDVCICSSKQNPGKNKACFSIKRVGLRSFRHIEAPGRCVAWS
jgi:hypothetical protein